MSRGGRRPGAGRPKGSLAKSTLEALKAREMLIAAYIKNIKPINDALIRKARKGDIQAIRELHDRVYGKAAQPLSNADAEGMIGIAHTIVYVPKRLKAPPVYAPERLEAPPKTRTSA